MSKASRRRGRVGVGVLALAHAANPTEPLGTQIVMTLAPIVVGVLIVVAAMRLFKGPLGASNPRRFGTLAVLLVAGLGAIWAIDRLLPH